VRMLGTSRLRGFGIATMTMLESLLVFVLLAALLA